MCVCVCVYVYVCAHVGGGGDNVWVNKTKDPEKYMVT